MARTQASELVKSETLQRLNEWWEGQKAKGEGLPIHHGRVSVHKLAKAAQLRRQIFDENEGWPELIRRFEEIIAEASELRLNDFQEPDAGISASAEKKIRHLERELSSAQKKLAERDVAYRDALEENVTLKNKYADYEKLKERVRILEWEEEVMIDTEGRTFFNEIT